MNRDIWEKIINFIPIKEYPSLPCPYCNNTSLFIDATSIKYRKSNCSKTTELIDNKTKEQLQVSADICEDNVFFGVLHGICTLVTTKHKQPAKFVCFFTCRNCESDVSATGTSQYPIASQNKDPLNLPLIKVEYFSPPIPIFNISNSVPIKIKNEVLQSFNHFHSDLCSSGTKLRRSIEMLCEELGYKEKNLHFTISSMEKDFPKEANLLHSLKLIGNEATHSDSISEEDLLNAFEVQDFVLTIFDRLEQEKIINERAAKLNVKFNKSNTKRLTSV